VRRNRRAAAGSADVAEIRRIVVASDLGEASQAALRLAVAIAKAFAADLLIVHVLPEPPALSGKVPGFAMTSGDVLERRLAQAESGLRRAKAIAGEGHAHAAIRCGTVAAEIIRLAKEIEADLIVLGRRDESDTDRKIALDVKARAPCPVLIVPAGCDHESPDHAGHVPSHGVLIATAGASTAALAYGRAMAQTLRCPVHALNAWPGPSPLSRALRRRVSQNVVSRAACPTLVIGPHCRWRNSGASKVRPTPVAASA